MSETLKKEILDYSTYWKITTNDRIMVVFTIVSFEQLCTKLQFN